LLSPRAALTGVNDGAHMLKITVVSLTLLGALSACSMFAGERVHSGYVGPAAMDRAQVTRLLNEHGYTHIRGLHKNGTDWLGSAMNEAGQQVNFDIDKAGTIHTK
jgi:hypothetical protein